MSALDEIIKFLPTPSDGRAVRRLCYGGFAGCLSEVNIIFILQKDLHYIQPSTNAYFDRETEGKYETI